MELGLQDPSQPLGFNVSSSLLAINNANQLSFALAEADCALKVDSAMLQLGRGKSFPPEKSDILWNHFWTISQYPGREEIEHLSSQTGLTKNQVTTWFNNKRNPRGSRAKKNKTHSGPEVLSLEEELFNLLFEARMP